MSNTRTETDTMGPIEVPAGRLWGAQTQRSRENFRIGEERMPLPLVRALGVIKRAAARTNRDLGLLDTKLADAIVSAGAAPAGIRPQLTLPGMERRCDAAACVRWLATAALTCALPAGRRGPDRICRRSG